MSSDHSVSVVIPSYNCESYIAQTLQGVLAQQVDDLEVLVVDDGSTDGTEAIVRRHDSRVRWVPQANAGVSRARNHGIELARGRYICLLDHDDWWFPHKLQRQLRAMDEHPEAGVVYSTWIVWRQPAPDAPFPDVASYRIDDTPDDEHPDFSGWVYHQFLLDCWMLTSTTMFRRELFAQYGGFDESLPFSEDWDLWLRLARQVPFVQLRRPTTLYRMHARQGSGWHRPVDYRTQLLLRNAAEHGLASRDGRAVTQRQFDHQLARYLADHARGELGAGRRGSAVRNFARAWGRDPLRWKYPAYLAAAMMGWRGHGLG
jgi:glycosyltransferase involved in cell wall biosynthesis